MKINTTDLKKVEDMLSAYEDRNGTMSIVHKAITNCGACCTSGCYNFCQGTCSGGCNSRCGGFR